MAPTTIKKASTAAAAPPAKKQRVQKEKVLDTRTDKVSAVTKNEQRVKKPAKKDNKKATIKKEEKDAPAPAEEMPWLADIEFASSSEGEMSSDEEAHEKDAKMAEGRNAVSGDQEDDEEEEASMPAEKDEFSGSAEEIKLTKKLKAAVASKVNQKAEEPEAATPGVIYLGRIPHGFYEEQMKAYFSQFGEVTRLRLSRNKKTGKSKHYAFLEFKHEEVAKIVAETMDNYLMFGHMLKCKVVPVEKTHPKLWDGADRKFRVIPYAKIHREKHNKPKTEEKKKQQQKRLLAHEVRLRDKLAEMGIEYDFPGYAGKQVKNVAAAAKKGASKRKADKPVGEAAVLAATGKEAPAVKKAKKPQPSQVEPATVEKKLPVESKKETSASATKKQASAKVVSETPKRKRALTEVQQETKSIAPPSSGKKSAKAVSKKQRK